MGSRWLRWAVVALALLAVYAAAGFWAVPAALRWQLPRLAASQLERPASVGEVRFNPFTLRLQVRDLRLAERDGTPLLAVAGIDAALDWRSAVRRVWSLRQVRIEAPQARLAVAPDGRFNLASLLDTLRSHREPREPQVRRDAGLPRVIVEDFALTGGRLEWDDRRADCHAVLAPMELRFAHLSTLPNGRDAWQLTADVAGGGRVRWRGEASLAPIRAEGEIVLEDLPLPTLGAYLKPYARAVVAGGRLSATLPYAVAYDAGQLQGGLHGARLALADLAAGHAGGGSRFASLREAAIEGIDADLARREAVVASVRVAGGELGLRRDAQGAWDLAQLLVARPTPAAPSAPPAPWKVAVRKLQAGELALRVIDESVRPALMLTAAGIGGEVRLEAGQAAQALALTLDGGQLQVERMALAQAGRPPVTLEHLGVQQAVVDLAGHRVEAGRIAVDGGHLRVVRDEKGDVEMLALLPRASGAPPASPAWTAHARQLAVSHLAIDLEDHGSGIRTQLQEVALRADGVGTDLSQPVRIEAGLRLREGGQLALQGQVVPATRTLDAQVQLRQLAVAAVQPLLARHVHLKLASGTLSTQGRLEAALPAGRPPVLRYTGGAELANLRLDELDGKLFARWKTMSAQRLVVGTRGLEVPELRLVAPEASLIIENDRSFNAARLLVRQPAQTLPARQAATAGEPFPVRIQRVRLQDARLDFLDQSLRPQFGARIYALDGVVTGLSSRRDARSQVDLEGRVDEAGLARVRGALNPFSPRDSTDLDVVFRNVDMVPASPYAMKFAGYRIAEGRISLDLRYHVRDGRLDGDNKVVIDRLTLGERVDSPDALKLPVELAIALLKDANGRIDLGLPVTGDLRDPKFSYTAILWKAFSNVLARAVAAPFRALAGLFGGSGEKLEAIDFDPGSDRLLPPEREKLRQVAQLLTQRGQLRLSVPGQFSEAADGAALRSLAVRAEVVRRAGLRLEPGESPGPLDFTDRGVRTAVRELYTQRFGAAEWDKAKAAAEAARPRGEASGAGPADVPVWRRVSNFVQGEPQVADAVGFYRGLLRRLEQAQPLASDALPQLGARRAQAVAAALAETGFDGARVAVAPPAAVQAADGGKAVPLKLELAAR